MGMSHEEWDRWSCGSAIRRAGYAGFRRNVAAAAGNGRIRSRPNCPASGPAHADRQNPYPIFAPKCIGAGANDDGERGGLA